MEFAGESLIVGPDGNVIFKADDIQQLIECDIDLKKAKKLRESKPYFSTRRPECYLQNRIQISKMIRDIIKIKKEGASYGN